jgi:hypothetical protein
MYYIIYFLLELGVSPCILELRESEYVIIIIFLHFFFYLLREWNNYV